MFPPTTSPVLGRLAGRELSRVIGGGRRPLLGRMGESVTSALSGLSGEPVSITPVLGRLAGEATRLELRAIGGSTRPLTLVEVNTPGSGQTRLAFGGMDETNDANLSLSTMLCSRASTFSCSLTIFPTAPWQLLQRTASLPQSSSNGKGASFSSTLFSAAQLAPCNFFRLLRSVGSSSRQTQQKISDIALLSCKIAQ